MPNCRIAYADTDGNVLAVEDFYDPYLFLGKDGRPWNWKGDHWAYGPTYGGAAIMNELRQISDPRTPPIIVRPS